MPSPCARRRTASGSIVHLFNDLNTTAGHGLPAEDVPLREEVLPIHDITVTFRRDDIARIHLEPGGKELITTKVNGGIAVTIPKLMIHALIVAELV